MLFAYFLLWASEGPTAGFVWSDVFPSMNQPGRTLKMPVCPGKKAPFCQQGEIHIITSQAITIQMLIAKSNLTI